MSGLLEKKNSNDNSCNKIYTNWYWGQISSRMKIFLILFTMFACYFYFLRYDLLTLFKNYMLWPLQNLKVFSFITFLLDNSVVLNMLHPCNFILYLIISLSLKGAFLVILGDVEEHSKSSCGISFSRSKP